MARVPLTARQKSYNRVSRLVGQVASRSITVEQFDKKYARLTRAERALYNLIDASFTMATIALLIADPDAVSHINAAADELRSAIEAAKSTKKI